MRNEYDIAVVIGRFQPIHLGHIPAFLKAKSIATKTVCVVGSANRPSDIKNPFSAEERIEMIKDVLSSHEFEGQDISFIPVRDTFYLETEWYRRVKEAIDPISDDLLKEKLKIYEEDYREHIADLKSVGLDHTEDHQLDNFLSLHGRYNKTSKLIRSYRELVSDMRTIKIAVLGHDKDPSSYYLKKFNWDLIDIGAWIGDSKHDDPISATDIRNLWFSGKLSFAKSNLPPKTYDYMLDYNETHYLNLKEEWEYIEQYKHDTQQGPFPVQFTTSDAVVIHGDHILMIKRGGHPGKGLWALPGGFKGDDENFFQAALRELTEETTIDVPKKILIGSFKEEKIFDYPKRSLRGTTVTVAHSFVLDPDGRPLPKVKPKSDAVLAWWFPISDVLKMGDQIFEDHLDIIEYMIARL